MEKLFLELLNRSITAGWLILAVILVRLLFRRAPKWVTGCLWLLVAVRLVIPFSFESVYSLIPRAETVPYEILYSERPTIDSGISVIDTVVNHSLESSVPVPGASVNPLQITAALTACLWIAGMTVLLISAAVSYVLLKRKVRTAVRLRENIKQSEHIATPFVLGIFRPTVYLPFSVDESEAEYIIAHEKTHIRHGDHLVKPLAFLLLSVYWFHPLMWLAYILLCRDIELACDERVIKNMSTDERRAYSTVLLEFSTKQRLITACPVAFGEVGVKTRVKSVLNYKKPAFWLIVLALAVCVVCGVCLLTDPQPIEGLPSAEEIAGITMDCVPSNTEVSMEDDEQWLPVMLEMFGKATKTYRDSYNDTPYTEDVDGGTYLKITFHYADETVSPSFQTYYLYSQKGKAYLMRPYDAVYRFDDEFYDVLYDHYFVSLREHTQDVYMRINIEKMEAEQRLEYANDDKEFYQYALEQKQAELIATRGEALEYARELAELKAAGASSEYYNAIFEGIRESIRYEKDENMIFYSFPEVPEVAYLDVTLTASYEDGTTLTVLRCDGFEDFSVEPGGKYSVTIAEGTTAITMHVTAESADGPCEVTFDLLDWAKFAHPETYPEGTITPGEIRTLMNAYLVYERFTQYDSSSITSASEFVEIDGIVYSKVTDVAYDTWDEWITFTESIFCGEALTRERENPSHFINVDGKTYCIDGAMGWSLSNKYTYKMSKAAEDSAVIELIREEIVPGEMETRDHTVSFMLRRTGNGWRIDG